MSEPKNTTLQPTPPATSYLNATGEITYRFTNDYMFRVILQKKQYCSQGTYLFPVASAPGYCQQHYHYQSH